MTVVESDMNDSGCWTLGNFLEKNYFIFSTSSEAAVTKLLIAAEYHHRLVKPAVMSSV
jgi:hypothetical protein